jgi:hypothetical protein
MKKLLVLAVLVCIVALPSFAQYPVASPYLIDFFANNPGPGGTADQSIRLVNVGEFGTPLSSPVGDICANVYVFDANQEMVSCCSCRITPNGLLSVSVANSLTNNPVTSVVPVSGAVKIISTVARGTTPCSPLTYNGGIAPSIVGWASHIETSGGTAAGTFISVAELLGWARVPGQVVEVVPDAPVADPNTSEYAFLPQACQFAQYLGSGKGTCGCR